MANEYQGPPLSMPGGRTPWRGPDYMPPLPGRPVGGNYQALSPESQAVGPVMPTDAQEAAPVVEDFRFANINSINVVAPFIAPGVGIGALLVINKPQSKRNFLGFRNPNAVGTLYVDFGQPATTGSLLAIGPGISVFFDSVVPQDDIWIAFDQVGGGSIALGYSNYKP